MAGTYLTLPPSIFNILIIRISPIPDTKYQNLTHFPSLPTPTGSGKTTFMQRINAHLHSTSSKPYVINLDPAVRSVPFTPNIDIRDSINYKEVMKQYKLGPNGGILTSLNLFATKVDQIVNLLEKRTKANPEKPEAKPVKHIIVDTPGQIEVFVWSASGAILLDSFASSFPTVIAYVIDTPRTASTSTFMSNMLYACSILYKTKLPMILVFNKSDVKDPAFAKQWMTDFEAFQAALRQEEEGGSFGGEGSAGTAAEGGSGYMSSLLNSMSLVLDEFYSHLSVVGVSSMTGDGIEDFFKAVDTKIEEFERDYRPELEKRQADMVRAKEDRRQTELGRLMKDMNVGGTGKGKSDQIDQSGTLSDMEEEEEDGDEDEKMVGDEDEDDDDGEGNGLQDRYKRALSGGVGGVGGPSDKDLSFERYLRSTKIG